MIKGIMARTQGLALEITPARKQAGKASHPRFSTRELILSRNPSI